SLVGLASIKPDLGIAGHSEVHADRTFTGGLAGRCTVVILGTSGAVIAAGGRTTVVIVRNDKAVVAARLRDRGLVSGVGGRGVATEGSRAGATGFARIRRRCHQLSLQEILA